MLLSQRKVLCFSIVIALFLSSCIPLDPSPSPTSGGSIALPARCISEEFHTYIAGNGAYCFLYPSGYLLDNRNSSESVSLTQAIIGGRPTISIDNAGSMDDVTQALPGGVALLIHYEDRHNDDSLSELVDYRQTDFHSPWLLDSEEAELVKAVDGNSFSYTIHAKRGDYYYQLMFSSSAGLSGNCESSTKLEELFFVVSATFTFMP